MSIKFFNKFFFIASVLILIGILFCILPASIVLFFTYRLVCLIIIVIGIVKLVLSDKKVLGEREYYLDLLEGFINIIVGVVCFNFFDNYTVSLVFGVLYLIIPILRIALSANKVNQLIMDVFKFIFAVMLIISTNKIPSITKFYSAGVFLVMGIFILTLKIVILIRNKNKDEELF